jgi:hypothetical protein
MGVTSRAATANRSIKVHLENKISSIKILKIPKSHQSKKDRQNNGQKKKGQKDLEN